MRVPRNFVLVINQRKCRHPRGRMVGVESLACLLWSLIERGVERHDERGREKEAVTLVLKARMNAQAKNLAVGMGDVRQRQREVASASSAEKAVWKAGEKEVEKSVGGQVLIATHVCCLSNGETGDGLSYMVHHLNV
jgi:hypothetical protein